MKNYFILIEESYIGLGPFLLWGFGYHIYSKRKEEKIFSEEQKYIYFQLAKIIRNQK